MGDLGFGEIVLIGMVALLAYGEKLPRVMRDAGRYVNKLKRHFWDIRDEINRAIDAEDEPPPAPASVEPEPPPPSDAPAAEAPPPAEPPPPPADGPPPPAVPPPAPAPGAP